MLWAGWVAMLFDGLFSVHRPGGWRQRELKLEEDWSPCWLWEWGARNIEAGEEMGLETSGAKKPVLGVYP